MDKIQQAIEILFHLAITKKPCNLTDISTQLGFNKVAVYRILISLAGAHCVTKDADTRTYALGERMLDISLAVQSHLNLKSISLPYLQEVQNLLALSVS